MDEIWKTYTIQMTVLSRMPVTRRRFLQGAAGTSLVLAGCTGGGAYGGGGENQQQQAGGGTQADKTIAMKSSTFQTLKAEVDTGATVKWVNNDGYAHTVTSTQFHDTATSWSFDKQVSEGGTVTHTFDESGVYEYYCTIHGKTTMCGAVLVGDASLNKELPCSGSGGGQY